MRPRLLPLALVAVCMAGQAAVAEGYPARVVDVTAGDILQVDHKGKTELVVLYGVVAGPSPLASKAAKQFAIDKALNQTVTVRVVERRPKMTLVELVLPDKSNLGQVMLRNGLVRWDTLTAGQDKGLKDLETLAKQERLGLWKSISADKTQPTPGAVDRAHAKPPAGADEKSYDRKMKAGYDILEGRSWKDEKGVRTIVLRGNGEKRIGFEAEAARRIGEANAAAQAEADRAANLEQMQMDQQNAGSNGSPY